MVKTCCAPNCRNRSNKPGISFFCFPKVPHLRREWVRRLNKANFQPTRHTVLCSEHFHGDNFHSESVPEFLQLIGLEQRPTRRRLKPGAVPTLFKNAKDEWQEWKAESEAARIQSRRRSEDGAVVGDNDEVRDEVRETTIKEEPGMEDEVMSDEEDRFVIQIDVAEEDQSPAVLQDLQPPMVSFIDHTGTSTHQTRSPSTSAAQPGKEIGANDSSSAEDKGIAVNHSPPQTDDSADDKEVRSTRPRRSCRNRGGGGLEVCQAGGRSQCPTGLSDDGGADSSSGGGGGDGPKVCNRDGRRSVNHDEEERGRRQRKSTHGSVTGSKESSPTKVNKLGDLSDADAHDNTAEGRQAEDPNEPRLCTIESVRTVQENDDEQGNDQDSEDPGKRENRRRVVDYIDDDEDDDEYEVEEKDDDSSGTYSPSVSDASSPPAKSRRSSRKKKPSPGTTATTTLGTAHHPAISGSYDSHSLIQQSNAGPPILCRIDPAFCKFQTVFQVPFASSPTFFSRTADSMVVSNSAPVNSALAVSSGATSASTSREPSDVAGDKMDRGIFKGSSGLVLSKWAGMDSAGDKTSDTRKGTVVGRDPSDSLVPLEVIVSNCSGSSSSHRLALSPVCTLPCCKVKPKSSGGASSGLIGSNNHPTAVSFAVPPLVASVKQEILDPDDPPLPLPLPHRTSPSPLTSSEAAPKPDSTVPALAAAPAPMTAHPHHHNLQHHLRSSSAAAPVMGLIPYRSEPINIPRYSTHFPYRSEPLRTLPVPIPTLPALLDVPLRDKRKADSKSKPADFASSSSSSSSRDHQKKPHSSKPSKSSGDRADAPNGGGEAGVAFLSMTGSGDGGSGVSGKRIFGYHLEKGRNAVNDCAGNTAAGRALHGKQLEWTARGSKSTTSSSGSIDGFAASDHPRGGTGGDGAGEVGRGSTSGGGSGGGGSGSGHRLLLVRQQLSKKSGSSALSSPSFSSASATRSKPSSAVDAVSARLLVTQQKTLSPMNLTKKAVADQSSSSSTGSPFFIRRDHILTDLLDIFRHSADRIQRDSVFRLCHDVSSANNSASPKAASLQDNWEDVPHKKLFSVFWAECLANYFDGYLQKVPKVDAQSSTSSEVPYLLGKILRHGLVLCGYWPVALSTACAVSVFTGEKCSQDLFLRSLRQTMFPFEAEALDELLNSAKNAHDEDDENEAVGVGMRERGTGENEEEGRVLEMRAEKRVGVVVKAYGGTQCQVPTGCDEVHAFMVELAAYYLYCQPFWWLREMRRGLLAVTARTRHDQDYLASMGEREVCDMYFTLTPTPQALLRRIRFRIDDGKQVSQNRVKGFLERLLLRLSQKELVRLLMKWSEADCLLDDSYLVIFASSSSSSSGTPPLFRPAFNTLVLGHACGSFDFFNSMFRRLLNVP